MLLTLKRMYGNQKKDPNTQRKANAMAPREQQDNTFDDDYCRDLMTGQMIPPSSSKKRPFLDASADEVHLSSSHNDTIQATKKIAAEDMSDNQCTDMFDNQCADMFGNICATTQLEPRYNPNMDSVIGQEMTQSSLANTTSQFPTDAKLLGISHQQQKIHPNLQNAPYDGLQQPSSGIRKTTNHMLDTPKIAAPSRRCSTTTSEDDSYDPTDHCLGRDYMPGPWNVVCGRGKNWHEYVSNRRFRIIVANHLFQYFETISRKRKSQVIGTIVETVLNSPGGSFVRKDPVSGMWYTLSRKEAREKVSHCLRDCLIDPQNEQIKWSLEQRRQKLMEAQNSVFRSLKMIQY